MLSYCHRSPLAWQNPAVDGGMGEKEWQVFHGPDAAAAAAASVCSSALHTKAQCTVWPL